MASPSMTQSETSTIAIPEDAHASSSHHKHKHGHQPHVAFPEGTNQVPDQRLTLTRTRSHQSHDETRPDLSFPFSTTDRERGGYTNEYRAVSDTGYVPADLALRPVPSRVYRLPQALADPEKAAALKQMKLVTWKEDDPEDPRNWSTTYRWCTFRPNECYLACVLIDSHRHHRRVRHRCRASRICECSHHRRLWRH